MVAPSEIRNTTADLQVEIMSLAFLTVQVHLGKGLHGAQWRKEDGYYVFYYFHVHTV